ncbi:hypothetical protein HGA88_04345 [Candidatus Roizmanbacteria bacterium]|nr:hypothetical protein [Candidatus Roizmanbacteria bacterium]
MFYNSPTYGKVPLERLKDVVFDYMSKDTTSSYKIIVGSDSQKVVNNVYDFVNAIVIHRVGSGGIYFWLRTVVTQTMSLKERMYREATMSLETSEKLVELFKEKGILRYNIEIHVDIGNNGKTRVLINELTAMIRGSGYEVKIKPDSFGASKVADKYT